MIDVNIKGVLYGIAAALPVFREQGSGHFVNLASTAAYVTSPNQAVHSGTKHAMVAVSEGLRKEAGPHLKVTITSPGFVRTGSWKLSRSGPVLCGSTGSMSDKCVVSAGQGLAACC